ncbi:DUF1810 domain-containing protein [Ideonella sp.]|uniref:DUF1810 domain-containing protein n=1 Tax=Ideonella sp. TaxID=1929293 RepID=UPI0035B0EA0B
MSPSGPDPFDLERFVRAQSAHYDTALAELQRGRKRTHWSWFVFPQLRGLGRSDMAVRYAISGLPEAAAFLAHATLGPRLRACVAAMNRHAGVSATAILGDIDATKFHSCVTLFAQVSPPGTVFHEALAIHFGGQPDGATLRLLADQRGERGGHRG